MIEVIPGINEAEFSEIERKIRLVESYVPWVQIDILDGSLFNRSVFHEAKPFADLDTHLLMEAHLMVKNPTKYVEPFFTAGFERFIAHVEGFSEGGETIHDFLHEVSAYDAEVALAVDMPTPIDAVIPYLESLDSVLVMSINSGPSGTPFQKEAISKIEAIRKVSSTIHIEVDGGINPETAPLVVKAGATRLAVTSAIFKSTSIKEAIERLRQVG